VVSGRNRRGWEFTLNTTAVLTLRNTDTGAIAGVLSSFPAHPTTLGRSNMQASSDFGGYLCRHVEGRLGAPAIWVNGALGDVSAVGQGGEHEFERPALYGAAAGERVLEAMALGETPIPGDAELGFVSVTYEEEITNLAFVAALALGVLEGYYDTVPGTIANIDTIAARIRFGDALEVVTSPGGAKNIAPCIRLAGWLPKVFLCTDMGALASQSHSPATDSRWWQPSLPSPHRRSRWHGGWCRIRWATSCRRTNG
jgi:hypothetical protein